MKEFGEEYLKEASKNLHSEITEEGVWKKYSQGTNPEILFNDIYEKGTGWNIAEQITVTTKNIIGGDIYIYYTKDKEGNFTIPRIAIRMENNKIGEIRGVAKDQNIESNMERVVKEKLNEFPDKEEYLKKVKDMEMLTYVYTKFENKVELTKEDLRFLYEIDDKIIGFGYEEDSRIQEIKDNRNIRKDLAIAFDCKEEEISFTKEEALSGNIKYHCGDLDLNSLTSAEGLNLPEYVGGYLDLRNLTSAEGLNLPRYIGGDLNLNSLTSAKGLNLPSYIGRNLILGSLTSAKGLNLPSHIGEGLSLFSLTSAKGLELPSRIDGDLDLNSLTSAEGLNLPEYVGGYLDLRNLTSAEGLKLPNNIRGNLFLCGLTSAKGLNLPSHIGEGLFLFSLTSAKGLNLPNRIDGSLNLESLTSAEGLNLPSYIGGYLDLGSLTSAEDLNLPSHIGGYLSLRSLTSADGLNLPDNFDGYLVLSDGIHLINPIYSKGRSK